MPDNSESITPSRRISICWFRRDLRISDNPALRAAAEADETFPLYIVSAWTGQHNWTGPKRQHFLCGCLSSLQANLESIGSRLHFRQGDLLEQLEAFITETGATELHAAADPDPYGKAVETRLNDICAERGVRLILHDGIAMHREDEVLKDDGSPYRVYTPYWRRWSQRAKPQPASKPAGINTPDHLDQGPAPTLATWGLELDCDESALPDAGESAARQRLKAALESTVDTYNDTRDIPGLRGTSRLSQDLRFGTLSIRYVFAEVQKRRMQADPKTDEQLMVYQKELAWRDFYLQLIAHFPEALEHEFNPSWRGLPWDEPGEQWQAFREGKTGFPIVDAGVRELLATGFMHNRVRMIVAMFLTKDLHIDWRLGESFFMQHLLDGEIASNNGGWQWSSGTGADAAPYFRIQNPWTQSKRYDLQATYIKKWCPELAHVPAKQLFEPPKDGGSVALGYPAPIVDHSTERDRTLAIFKQHKEAAS